MHLFEIIFITSFIWLVGGGVFLILSFVAFDRLLRQIISESRELWNGLGKPIGFFWVPPGATAITAGGFARGALYTQWSGDHTPPPAGEPETIARYRFFSRMSQLSFIVGFLQLLGAAAVIMAD